MAKPQIQMHGNFWQQQWRADSQRVICEADPDMMQTQACSHDAHLFMQVHHAVQGYLLIWMLSHLLHLLDFLLSNHLEGSVHSSACCMALR